MELAILFWCYKEAEVCANRLRLLRHYNPGAPIYVLFGGEPAEAQRFETEFQPFVDDFYAFPDGKSPEWKWHRGDMLISRWFSDRGCQLKWDSIAIIQWDMLTFAPVEKLFGHLKKDELLLSGARPVAEVKAWWPWVQAQHQEYPDFLNENHLHERDAWCCEFIVAVFPRAFLEQFSGRENPETGFLEYTIPTLAKAWGFEFCTHHPYTPWWNCNPDEFGEHPYHKMLNAIGEECPDRYVLLHLLDPWGLRIFHPYSRDIRADSLSPALPAWLNFLRCTEWDSADLFGESTRAMARQLIAGNDLAVSGALAARRAICLNMVVRNKAPVIKKVLDSVAAHISSWVIVDTGSDDGTQDLIRDHMTALGIPGELYERPWQDFGHNRTEALTLAQGHGDYIWVIDADDILVGTPDFTRLGTSVYRLHCVDDNGDTFWRAQLFRDGVPVRYEGATQEYAAWDDDSPAGVHLEGNYHIRSRCLGAPDNPEDGRSVFSLAENYFGLGDFVNARTSYARRVGIGGWDEEVFFAMYRLAETMAQLGEPWPDVQDAYLKAWAFRPTRGEPLYAIAVRYRLEGQYHLGYLFARHAERIPLPETDTLFVAAHIYTWCLTDELAICAAQTGKLAEAFMLNRRLLASPDLPDTQRERIAVNRDFSVPAMLEAASSYPDALIANLTAGPPDAEITVTLIAGPDHTTTEHTLNSFLNCCTDLTRIGRYLIADTGLPPTKRAALQQRYPFLEFIECADGAELRTHINGRFWLHLDQGWRFFAPDNLITRLTAILTTETQVVQVGINLADATTLTSTSANEHTVHRTPDTGRYVLTNAIANGPAMVDTTRPRHTTPPHTATLDEILCIADLLDGREGGNA